MHHALGGTRRGTRLLTPFRQALYALAWFRDRVEVERLGPGFGLSRATAYRYLEEAVRVLSAQALRVPKTAVGWDDQRL